MRPGTRLKSASGRRPAAGVLRERRGPGQSVSLSSADAERLTELPYVQDVAPVIPAPKPVNPAQIGLETEMVEFQGPSYVRP